MAGRKRTHAEVDASPVQPESMKRERIIQAHAKSNSDHDPKIQETPAAIFHTPKNSQATLSGLPAELRLQIYSYLCDSTIIHVHSHRDSNDPSACRFTWTPCRSPSSASPLLCANPKWSGMCEEEERCTYKIYAPPEPVGFWALAASCKMIRNESQEYFLRETVVSIHPQDLQPWMNHLAEHDPRQLESIRRVTLAGPNNVQFVSIRDRLPNLEALGLQCQEPIWRWVRSRNNDNIQIDGEAWRRWYLMDWLKHFDPSITIVLEALIWQKARPRWNTNTKEQQAAIRIIREGKAAKKGSAPGSGWTDEDVAVEIVQPGKLASGKRNAKWRQWWRGKEMKGFA